jgi:uncharacterized protein
MDESDPLRALIEYMARGLADEPEAVKVVVVPGAEGTLYRLEVAPRDTAKIIEKQNHTDRSIRIILSAIASKLKRKVSFEISE